MRKIALASFGAKAIYAMCFWGAAGAAWVFYFYSFHGSSRALAELGEFGLMSVVLAFVAPSVVAGQWLEPRLKRQFPLGAPFLVIAVTLIPSVLVGFWVAAALMRRAG